MFLKILSLDKNFIDYINISKFLDNDMSTYRCTGGFKGCEEVPWLGKGWGIRFSLKIFLDIIIIGSLHLTSPFQKW